jgi:integrase
MSRHRDDETMANLYKRGETWWIDVHPGDGRRVRESTGTRKRSEAQAYLMRRTAKLLEEASVDDAHTLDMPLSALRDSYLMSEPESNDAGAEVRAWGLFVGYMGEHTKVGAVTTKRCSDWAMHLSQKYKPSSVHRYTAAVSAVFGWARRAGLLNNNPLQGSWRPKNKQDRVEGVPPKDVGVILGQLQRGGHETLYRAYLLAFYAGLRQSEIARARWEDVDLEAGVLQVRGEKTSGSDQAIPLHPKLLEWMRSVSRREGYIIGSKRSPSALANLRRRAIEGGLDLPGFHRGRHTLGTTLARAGVDMARISKLLRHSNVTTTMRYYAHLRAVDAADDLSLLSFSSDEG